MTDHKAGVPTLNYFVVDAFAERVFSGNPAGVCPLDGTDWLADDLMQSIAAENNLSETAFLLRKGDRFGLRWFTPTLEIDLCGHATVGSAFVIFTELGWKSDVIEFDSKSGVLKVERKNEIYELDFPSRPAHVAEPPPELIAGLGATPLEILKARDWMGVFACEEDVLAIQPNFDLLAKAPGGKVIVTAPAKNCDFVSRFFAPGAGVNEDPVTGSSHCTLIPYWAAKLNKTKLHARQVSKRGGELFCELRGERVGIGGRAALYSKGRIFV